MDRQLNGPYSSGKSHSSRPAATNWFALFLMIQLIAWTSWSASIRPVWTSRKLNIAGRSSLGYGRKLVAGRVGSHAHVLLVRIRTLEAFNGKIV